MVGKSRGIYKSEIWNDACFVFFFKFWQPYFDVLYQMIRKVYEPADETIFLNDLECSALMFSTHGRL